MAVMFAIIGRLMQKLLVSFEINISYNTNTKKRVQRVEGKLVLVCLLLEIKCHPQWPRKQLMELSNRMILPSGDTYWFSEMGVTKWIS